MSIIKQAGSGPAGGYPDATVYVTLVDLKFPATSDFYCNAIAAQFKCWTSGENWHLAIGSVVGTTYTPRHRISIPKPVGPVFPTIVYFKAPTDFRAFPVYAGECIAASNGNFANWYADNTSPARETGIISNNHIWDASFVFTRYVYPPSGVAINVQIRFSEEDGTACAGYVSESSLAFEPAGNGFELEVVDTPPIPCPSIMVCDEGCIPVRETPRLIRSKP